jgi:hypothetical protein
MAIVRVDGICGVSGAFHRYGAIRTVGLASCRSAGNANDRQDAGPTELPEQVRSRSCLVSDGHRRK